MGGSKVPVPVIEMMSVYAVFASADLESPKKLELTSSDAINKVTNKVKRARDGFKCRAVRESDLRLECAFNETAQ